MREKTLHRAVVLAATGVVFGMTSAAHAATTTVGTFSGSASLDLSGTFIYGLDVGGDGTSRVVGGVTFTDDNVPGVTITSNHNDFSYQTPNYDAGTTTEDNLENITRTIQWSDGSVLQIVTMDLDVIQGNSYKLQMLFQDDTSGNRGFDVLAEGSIIVDNFGSSTGNLTSGRLITYEFTAADSVLNIKLDGPNAGFPDGNAILSAATLELVPEPTSLAVLGLAIPLLFKRRR